jgi:hypothetical protein
LIISEKLTISPVYPRRRSCGDWVLEYAIGYANVATGEKCTPRHRFRVDFHSKAFAAAGVMTPRGHGRICLDDRFDRFVSSLTPEVWCVTISQLLSHSAGLTRDGPDAGQFQDHRDFQSVTEFSHRPSACTSARGGKHNEVFKSWLRSAWQSDQAHHRGAVLRLDAARNRWGSTEVIAHLAIYLCVEAHHGAGCGQVGTERNPWRSVAVDL